MVCMAPYENPVYFVIFGIAAAPLVALSLAGKRANWYRYLLSLYFLLMSFGGANARQGIALIFFAIFQVALSQGYLLYRRRRNRTEVFILAVALSLSPLIAFKLSGIAFAKLSAIGFLGISYLTFKSVQVIIEMRDGLIKHCGPVRYIRFLLFFPVISAGPIDRYRRFDAEAEARLEPGCYAELLEKGIHSIFLGFLYNHILGRLLGGELLPIVEDYALTEGNVFLGSLMYMYVYSLYLFFDFAGYTQFAVGVSRILGFDIPPNFNKPFLSRNMKDFWNRWHMSLSFWFRDYVYMRLLMLLMRKKVCKSRVLASNIAYFALFMLMGAWHGLTRYYIAYGLFHAIAMCVNDAWLRFKKKHRARIPQNRLTNAVAIALTFHVACFGFLIFSGFIETAAGF
ncbi:MAG: D-alanyl-lipoteichoic acid biosynthesis protein DltB [Clostridiales Family XIII bacterium]|jgi:membrane protein involved in D-alanine export|nr:D-alanyl-lipoteichoic acid biosynthesis protein DltB [Clostridiales Family XIII bacterium]